MRDALPAVLRMWSKHQMKLQTLMATGKSSESHLFMIDQLTHKRRKPQSYSVSPVLKSTVSGHEKHQADLLLPLKVYSFDSHAAMWCCENIAQYLYHTYPYHCD